MTTDAQAALAQVREALAAGPTPGRWEQKPKEVGTSYIRVRGTRLGCRYKIANVLTPIYDGAHELEAQETRANARLIAACSPANMTAILAHVEAQEAEIERLTAELETERMRLAACGVVALANTEQSAAKEREMMPEYRSASLADVERAVDREMQLRAERDELRRQFAEAQKEIHNLNWALGTEGYDQMATPEEQAEHEAAVRAHHDVLERLEEGKRAYDAMKRDAECWRELDQMMSDPDARLSVNASGWAVLKCGLLGKLGANDA